MQATSPRRNCLSLRPSGCGTISFRVSPCRLFKREGQCQLVSSMISAYWSELLQGILKLTHFICVTAMANLFLLQLNYLHRMSARVLCVLVWLHAAGRVREYDLNYNCYEVHRCMDLADQARVIVTLKQHDSATDNPHRLAGLASIAHAWIRCAVLAATALTILCIVTIRPMRDRNYQFFLVVHGVLSLCVFRCIPKRISINKFCQHCIGGFVLPRTRVRVRST